MLIRVQASGPGPGYTMHDWNMVRWLGTAPHIIRPEESSMEAEKQCRALERLQNSPITNRNSLSSSLSRTLNLRNKSDILVERATHQHICHSQIQEMGQVMVPDQGIVFNRNNIPRDIKPEQKLKKEESIPASGRG